MNKISNTFLFDKYRSGRMNYNVGDNFPRLKWEYEIPSFPIKGPESTPVFDDQKNIYFGCHDGCFYSLTSNGKYRWHFKTEKKIYSSPLLEGEFIIFANGDGYLFCFQKNSGKLVWVYDIAVGFRPNKLIKRLFKRILTLNKSIDLDRKRIWDIKCWSSPISDENGTVYISGFGIGLHAINLENGECRWKVKLEGGNWHLSGAVLDDEGNIYISSQRRYVYCISNNGNIIWKKKVKGGYDNWGNPSIDIENRIVYYPFSKREKKGIVYAYKLSGEFLWCTEIDGGVRGTATISYEDYIVICSLAGEIIFLNKITGKIQKKIKLTDAPRGLWTSASISPNGDIFVTTKESNTTGSLVRLNKNGDILWRIPTGKALSIPVIDEQSNIYIGSWNGKFLCYNTTTNM